MAKFKASHYNHFVPLEDGREITYNALSRSLEVLSANDVDRLREVSKGDDHDDGDAQVLKFTKNGYLVRDDVDELSIVREMYATARFKGSQMTLTVMPTASCNFGCDYCFQGADKPQEWMSDKVQDQLLKFIERRLPDLKALSITWYGGEPLLALDVIRNLSKKVIALCKQYNVTLGFMIVTNGYKLNKAVADELYGFGVRVIQVTLDGPCDAHDQRRHLLGGQGTYRRIVENLKDAVQQTGVKFSVRVNVDSRDAHRIGELLEDLAAQGLANRKNLSVYPAPVESYTEGCHEVSDFIMNRSTYAAIETDFFKRGRSLKLIGSPTPPLFSSQCGAIKQTAWVVTPTGDLHKCWNTVNESDKRVGNIFDEERIFSEPNANHDIWLSWTPFQDPICRTCTTLPLCSGNCAYRFVHADEMKTPDERPCPSWKYNLKDKLVMLAVDRKLVPHNVAVKPLPVPANSARQTTAAATPALAATP
jgi:uncharacterized protein